MITHAVLPAFTGSYLKEDCIFLLNPIKTEMLSIEEKEKRLQSGVHYSEMISVEQRPDAVYEALFFEMLNKNKGRMAVELLALAHKIKKSRGQTITLLSLARAGTPIGVLLNKILNELLGCTSTHYSISIIRDKGLDEAALRYVTEHYDSKSIVFVDGWTAKGTITTELKAAVKKWNDQAGHAWIPDELCVLSDVSGTADIYATTDDYVIPSGILNSTVSGLVSRTIAPKAHNADEFHQCVFYENLKEFDLTYLFIDATYAAAKELSELTDHQMVRIGQKPVGHNDLMVFIDSLMEEYGVSDINKVKPGIAEATRVMLRRIPEYLIIKDKNKADVQHLLHLAGQKNITVIERADMPFNAVSIIKTLD